jgi:ketosteroid isomerase-like protein
MRTIGWAIAAVLLAGCEVSNAPASNESASAATPASAVTEAEAQKIAAEMHAAFMSGDAAKIMAHYAPGAAMFDPGHAQPATDKAVQTGWTEEFVRMSPADLVTKPTIQLAGPDAFVAYGTATFTGNFDGRAVPLSTRYSQLFQRQSDGQWKVIHEHMSLPPEETSARQAPAQ